MKKYLLLIFTTIISVCTFINVNAISTSLVWSCEHLGNNCGCSRIDMNPVNKDVSAYHEWKGGNEHILHLNNYNGSGLIFGLGAVGNNENTEVIIDLVGNNTITSNDIGINLYVANNKKIKFTGTGTLTINARIPVSNDTKAFYDPSNENNKDNQINVTINDTSEATTTTKEQELDYKPFFIGSLITNYVFIAMTILLSMKLAKLKRKNNPQ